MFKWLRDAFRFDGIRDDEIPPDSDWRYLTQMERIGIQTQADADIAKKLIAQRKRAALREENKRLRSALRLVMACAGDIDAATDADLESALECGDKDTERQANAWLVARAALKTPKART